MDGQADMPTITKAAFTLHAELRGAALSCMEIKDTINTECVVK